MILTSERTSSIAGDEKKRILLLIFKFLFFFRCLMRLISSTFIIIFFFIRSFQNKSPSDDPMTKTYTRHCYQMIIVENFHTILIEQMKERKTEKGSNFNANEKRIFKPLFFFFSLSFSPFYLRAIWLFIMLAFLLMLKR